MNLMSLFGDVVVSQGHVTSIVRTSDARHDCEQTAEHVESTTRTSMMQEWSSCSMSDVCVDDRAPFTLRPSQHLTE